MIWVGLFLLIFVGGPLIFRAMTRHVPSRRGLQILGSATALFAVAGMGVRYGLPHSWSQALWSTLLVIGLIWLAWIAVLAFAAQAVRRTDRSLRMRRLTGVIGALGTTMPWFGLAAANMLGM